MPAVFRKPVTIHRQFLFALIGVNMLVMLVTSAVFYAEQKQSLLSGIDEKLTSVAMMARETLPPDYHDRITGQESVSDAEFHRIVDRNNRLCVELGLEYIWSLMAVDGRIVFTTSTSPDKVADNRKHAKFFEPHSNPELYTNTFATMQATYKSSHDKWGDNRVALILSIDSHGHKFLFGASVRLTEVDRQLRGLVWQSVIVGLAVFAFSMVVGVWAAEAMTRNRENMDPSEFVLDEVAGQFIALWAISYPAWAHDIAITALWPGWIAAFVLFRLFDIWKPGPVGWADRQKGATGVMMDDIIAGILAAIGVAALAGFSHGVLGM